MKLDCLLGDVKLCCDLAVGSAVGDQREDRNLALGQTSSGWRSKTEGCPYVPDEHLPQSWQDVIESALATCDALLTWLTPDFPASKWTDQEVGFAVSRSILVVPVRRGLNPYGFIGKYQGLQGLGKEIAQLTDEIVDVIATSDLTASRLVRPAALAFMGARSFYFACAAFKTLTKLPRDGWTDDILDGSGTSCRREQPDRELRLREREAPRLAGAVHSRTSGACGCVGGLAVEA